jgi:hypothetical protein
LLESARTVAASPIVIGIALEPLTDVPVMTAWAISIYVLLTRIGGRLSPAIAGLAATIAILIRPNLVRLIIPLGMWYVIRRQTDGDSRLLSSALFALAALPAILLIAFLNDRLYGAPLSSRYGSRSFSTTGIREAGRLAIRRSIRHRSSSADHVKQSLSAFYPSATEPNPSACASCR